MAKRPAKPAASTTRPASVGELLRSVRVNTLQKSVRDLAKLLGVAPIHVSDIETGKRTPSEELLIRIAKVYRIDESVLRAGFERPEGVVGEVANESATAAKKVPEFLRTARGLDAKQWDHLIAQAKLLSSNKKERDP